MASSDGLIQWTKESNLTNVDDLPIRGINDLLGENTGTIRVATPQGLFRKMADKTGARSVAGRDFPLNTPHVSRPTKWDVSGSAPQSVLRQSVRRHYVVEKPERASFFFFVTATIDSEVVDIQAAVDTRPPELEGNKQPPS